MLVLSRKLGEKLYIGDNICITVVAIERGKIRLGVEAPRDTAIFRDEILGEADKKIVHANIARGNLPPEGQQSESVQPRGV